MLMEGKLGSMGGRLLGIEEQNAALVKRVRALEKETCSLSTMMAALHTTNKDVTQRLSKSELMVSGQMALPESSSHAASAVIESASHGTELASIQPRLMHVAAHRMYILGRSKYQCALSGGSGSLIAKFRKNLGIRDVLKVVLSVP